MKTFNDYFNYLTEINVSEDDPKRTKQITDTLNNPNNPFVKLQADKFNAETKQFEKEEVEFKKESPTSTLTFDQVKEILDVFRKRGSKVLTTSAHQLGIIIS